METHIWICAILLLYPSTTEIQATRLKSRQLPPTKEESSFLRDSVERTPEVPTISNRLAALKILQQYGSRSLPLRESVESIPDIIKTSKRVPLRDAVEYRLPPEDLIEEITVGNERRGPPIKYGLDPNAYILRRFPGPNITQGGIYLRSNINNQVAPTWQSWYKYGSSPKESWQSVGQRFGTYRSLGPFTVENGFHYIIEHETNKSHKRRIHAFRDSLPREIRNRPSKKIVCYLEAKAAYRKEPLNFTPENLDPFLCTHVIYSYAAIDPHSYKVVSNDPEYDIVRGGYKSATGLKRINPDLKILISIGGSREDSPYKFTNLVSNSSRRREFIRSLIDFIKEYNFDGVDIHWHYPGATDLGGSPSDKQYLTLLLEEISEIFKVRGWVLSVAVPSSRFRVDDGFDPPRLGELVDFINLEAYNFHKEKELSADHHASLNKRPEDEDINAFFNGGYAVRFWVSRGFPASKIIFGIPFYGRSVTLQNQNQTEIGSPITGPGIEGYYTQSPGYLAYFEICDLINNQGYTKKTDHYGMSYIVKDNQWISYDDHESIASKVDYVQRMGLGGIHIWTVDLDDFQGLCGAKWPLLNTINLRLNGFGLRFDIEKKLNKLSCNIDGIYTDPHDCSAYFVCNGGQIQHLHCPKSQFLNPSSGECESMSEENCRPGQSIYFTNPAKSLAQLRKQETDDGPKVVCYVTNWAFYRKGDGKFVPEYIDQRLCTHVVYAFATLDPEKLQIKEFDPWADLDNDLYQRITSLHDTNPLLSLGGWTDSSGDKYSRLVSNPSTRRQFIIGVVNFLRRYGFRGLHFDWNYPVCWQSSCRKERASDKINFSKLIEEMKKEFDKENPRFILAASISGYKEIIDVAYDLESLGRNLDFMSVMTYDYHGAWEKQTGHVSPLYYKPGDKYPQYNANFTMEYLVSLGAPRKKLLMGIPFYGQSYTLAKNDYSSTSIPAAGPGEPGEYTKQPGMLAYYEICHRIRKKKWVLKKDKSGASGPYAYSRDQWVGFENIDSVRRKAQYIKSRGFGGAVAWTIDLDDFTNRCCGGQFPLLHHLNQELGRIEDIPTGEDCTKPPPPVTPIPPVTTTGVDSGAMESSTEHHHHPMSTTTTTKKPVTWWSTTEKSTTSWWSSSTTASTTTKPTSTTPWWTPEPTTIPSVVITMPEPDVAPQPCHVGQYLPDPANCNSYYRCVLGELKKQYCAGGLHWNKERNICDWPDVAKCIENSSHTSTTTRKPVRQPTKKPTTKTTTERYTTPKPTWTTRRTTTRRPTRWTTRRPLTSTSANYGNSKPCTTGDYLPHKHCSSFYICVEGELVPQSCAPGLSWNAEMQMCDWAYKVKCHNRQKLAEKYTQQQEFENKLSPTPFSPCNGNAFAPHPGDCTKYLHCLWDKYEIFQCAPGLHWNSDKQICDWPSSSQCDTGGEANTISSQEPSWNPTPWQPEIPSTEFYPDWKPTTPSTTTTEAPELAEPLKPQSGYFKVVCYFTNWAWYRRDIGKYLPEDIDPNLCTHIVYGFAVLDYENLIIKAHDSWADFDNRFYERVVAFKAKGVKVSLAIGGWNDSQGDKYSRLVNSPAARAKFIRHVMEFLEKYNFDGLDLDWEYPKCWQVDCKKGPDSDKQAFSAFVVELKQAFRPKGYLLSSAVSPSKTVIDAGYDVPVLAKNLDWIAVMTYDFHGQWDKKTGHVAPLYYHPDDDITFFNANYSINYWISQGAPRRKLVMGMPLYGQSFQLETESNNGLNAKAPGPGQAGEFTRAAGFLAYYEICHNLKNNGWTVVKDPERRMGPYAYKGNQWVSFDDQEMIKIKSEYIRKMDLGGGMIWALDLDDFKNRCGEGRHPLLTIIRNVLAEPGSGPIDFTESPEEEESEEKEPEMPPSYETTLAPVVPQSTTMSTLVNPRSEFKVVCYFTNWAWYRQGKGKYLPSDIDPDLCTHIVYGFAVLNGDQLIIKPHDSWADFDNKFYEKVTAFKAKGIKVLIAIGGWNDSAGDKYSKLVNNPSARRRFITHVLDFIKANNFDGLDLDWEYPKCWQVDCNKGPASDKPAFADFVRELYEAFQPRGLLLSSAVSPSKRVIDAGYDVAALSKYLDWIAVMCYDYHGQWDKITGHVSPMYDHPDDIDATFNTNFTIHYWIEQGADRKKLVMGMPMYGQSFSLADNNEHGLNAPTYGGGEAGEETRARGFLAYYEICSNVINKGWTVVRDKQGRMGPYAFQRDQWVSFDDVAMIRYKSQYIKAMGLGGGMIWALDLDDFRNICGCEEYPLLRTINRVLRDYAIPDPMCKLGPIKKRKPQPEKPPRLPSVVTTNVKPGGLDGQPCNGRLFVDHPTNCNQYYFCNLGVLQMQHCSAGLYWNKDHCDWPENTPCHPDATTLSPTTTQAYEPEESNFTYAPPTVEFTGPGTSVATSGGDLKMVCYFTNWAWYRQGDGKYLPEDIDPTLCTHISYGFAVLDANSLTIKPHDSWADIDNDFYKRVIAYQAKGIKVLIALGGWNDSLGDKYSRLVNDPQARARFIKHVIQFIEKWGFDGLDFDWEYPKCWQVDCKKGPDSDKQEFARLIRELSRAFKSKGLLLSAAVSPSKTVIDAGYDVASISQDFDWIAVMTYDFHGHWDKQTGHVAPLYYYPGDVYDFFNANYSLHYWIKKGAPPKKLVMGIPLYGQSFTLADPSNRTLNVKTYGPGEAGEFTRAGGFLAFYEVCERVKKRGWTVVRDPQGRIGPYAYSGNQWVSYDDIAEIKRKVNMIKNLGLGGGMIWALDLDDFRNRCGCGKHPLLKTLNHELRGTPTDVHIKNCT